MMRRRVTRVVDACAGQQRVIMWLECEHKISISLLDMHTHKLNMYTLKSTTEMECPFCQDATPEDVSAAKTSRQLWKDAGEP